LGTIHEPLVATTPVLTEAFHLPASRAATALRTLIRRRDASVWFMSDASAMRALDLMDKYADHPMDFAGAWMVTLRVLRTTRAFRMLEPEQ
jgi:hypothetical protein